MKKVALASMLVVATASASFAGGYSEPEMAPTVIVEESSSSSNGSMGGNALLLLLGAAALAVALDS